MNNKGYMFDLVKLNNGLIITLISIFKIGFAIDRRTICIVLGILKLELTLSLKYGEESVSTHIKGMA